MINIREHKRINRHRRIRKRIQGSSQRLRLCVHRSLKNLTAQLVDDETGRILFGMSTLSPQVKTKMEYGGNIKAASLLGESFASKAKEKGIVKVCFDRGGYLYHGRVKAFAEAARKNGLEF